MWTSRAIGWVMLAIAMGGAECAMGYESLYERTAAGEIEIKRLASCTALQTESGRSYFQSDNRLFLDLFDYIRDHEVPMTVPVEADVSPGRMRFLVGTAAAGRDLPVTERVRIVERPARTVLSVGRRGGYTREAYDRALADAREWLAAQQEWEPDGEPSMVYWHAPWVPNPLKRSELHLPVQPRTQP